jgi:hypothetical protein
MASMVCALNILCTRRLNLQMQWANVTSGNAKFPFNVKTDKMLIYIYRKSPCKNNVLSANPLSQFWSFINNLGWLMVTLTSAKSALGKICVSIVLKILKKFANTTEIVQIVLKELKLELN